MATFAETCDELDTYLRARIPVVGIQTVEQPRAVRALKQVAEVPRRAAQPFWIHARATGLRDLRSGQELRDDRSLVGAFEFATQQFGRRAHATVALVDPEGAGSDTTLSRHLAEVVRQADANSGTVVVISDTPLWSGVQRLGMSVCLDLPDAEEMNALVREFLAENAHAVTVEWLDEDIQRAATYLVGVTESTAINALATLITRGSLRRTDVDQLADLKDRHFTTRAGLERIPVRRDPQVGGMQRLKEWLRRRRELIVADLRGTALRPPRGVLLTGVPGCGKSLSAKATAAAWRLPLYRLDPAAIYHKWVGESEHRIREALATADRLAPCVLWIDEIEKALAGQDDNTGVGRRLLGHFLYWLQESPSRVFVVATCNDVQALPAELLRKGRFDETFFVDLPDADERREIITLYHNRYLGGEPSAESLEALVLASTGFSGAEIDAALHESGVEAHVHGAVSDDVVLNVFNDTSPLSCTSPDKVSAIREWGEQRAVSASF